MWDLNNFLQGDGKWVKILFAPSLLLSFIPYTLLSLNVTFGIVDVGRVCNADKLIGRQS